MDLKKDLLVINVKQLWPPCRPKQSAGVSKMFEQHEREEIARMEVSNLRRQVANQSCVIAELKAKSSSERQAQHEATWAMALDAAAMVAPAYDHRVVAEHIKAIPCPPLQTTNEESEK